MAITTEYAQQMAQQLAYYDVQAKQTSLSTRETQYNAQVKALNSLKSALTTFSSAVRGIATTTGTQKSILVNKTTLSEEGYASASATGSAMEGSYTFKVDQLAKKHQLALGGLDESQLSAGGRLRLTQPGEKTGDAAREFELDLTGINTLNDLAAAINAHADNEGVQATIVRSGESVNLVLTSKETGLNQTIDYSFSDTTAADNLSVKMLSKAQNAEVRLGSTEAGGESLLLESASNTFKDTIAGVSVTFTKEHKEGESLTLDIAQDTSATKTKVEGFVSAYNTLMGSIKSMSASGVGDEGRGALAGDSSVNAIKSMVNNLMRSNFDGANLVSFGVRATSTGTLSLDSATFDKAFAADPEALDKLFSGKGNLVDSLTNSLKVYTASAGGVLTDRVATLNDRLSVISEDYDKLQTKYDNAYTRYLKQYTNMMQTMNSMEQTSGLFTIDE